MRARRPDEEARHRKALAKEKTEDRQEAQEWLKKATEAGNAIAMSFLGRLCEEGRLVAKSRSEAFRLFKGAAASGVCEHVLRLARCYRRGMGTPVDLREARRLYKVAETAAEREGDGELLARARLLQSARLSVPNWNWEEDSGYMVAEGEVLNLTDSPIRNLQAVVVFKSDDGKLVTSSSALVEYNPVMPGQSSPFKVMARYNPLIEEASVAFHVIGGPPIPSHDETEDGL